VPELRATRARNDACAARCNGSDDSGWFFHNRTPGFGETRISTLPNEAIALFSRNLIEPLHLLPRHFCQPPAPPSVPFRSVRVWAGVQRSWDRHDGASVALGLRAPILEWIFQQTLEKGGLQLWIQSCYSSSTNHFRVGLEQAVCFSEVLGVSVAPIAPFCGDFS
jgi:hypothetical protein